MIRHKDVDPPWAIKGVLRWWLNKHRWFSLSLLHQVLLSEGWCLFYLREEPRARGRSAGGGGGGEVSTGWVACGVHRTFSTRTWKADYRVFSVSSGHQDTFYFLRKQKRESSHCCFLYLILIKVILFLLIAIWATSYFVSLVKPTSHITLLVTESPPADSSAGLWCISSNSTLSLPTPQFDFPTMAVSLCLLKLLKQELHNCHSVHSDFHLTQKWIDKINNSLVEGRK